MFFRSPKSTILAIILLSVVGFQLIQGLTYADAAKREATTVGTITRVECGRSSCTYGYVFKINQFRIQDDSSTCRPALSRLGCGLGAPVLVYYNPEDLSVSTLQEFGAAGRGRIFMGSWMIACGLLLIGLYLILNKYGKHSAESEEPDEIDSNGETDVLHIAPSE